MELIEQQGDILWRAAHPEILQMFSIPLNAGLKTMTDFTVRITVAALLQLVAIEVHAGSMPSLYTRLGGNQGVTQIANDLIDRVAADPGIGGSFQGTNLLRVKAKLAEQLCELADGPCKYSGDSMRETHANHHITEADFYGMVEALKAVLRQHQVGLRETNEVLRLLAPMKRDIVEPPVARAHQ